MSDHTPSKFAPASPDQRPREGKRNAEQAPAHDAAIPKGYWSHHDMGLVQMKRVGGISLPIGYLQRSLSQPAASDSVQRRAADSAKHDSAQVHEEARHGASGSAGTLPFLDTIQRSFGRHDVTAVQAHVDEHAASAARAMGASAYAVGSHVAFAGNPDLHTAAHEAAHVVQQRTGVHLQGGVGAAGDRYEQHADAVADKVVRGESAEALLDRHADPGRASGARALQRKEPDQASGSDGSLTDDAVKAAVKANKALNDTLDIRLLRVRAFFRLPITRTSDEALAHAIAAYQAKSALPVHGKADDKTQQKMRTDGFLTKAWYAQLDAKDRQAVQAGRDTAKAMHDQGSGARATIAAVAMSQVGLVNAYNRGDGKKYGHEAIAAYYSDIGMTMDKLQREQGKLPQSWCGIFATWCVKTATGAGSFTQGVGPNFPFRSKLDDPGLSKAKVGDILSIPTIDGKEENHMSVIIQPGAGSFQCVGGNTLEQQVARQSFGLDVAAGYWVTAADPQASGAGQRSDSSGSDAGGDGNPG